jgi:hypothetical protein
MRNKANFQKSQMFVTSVLTMDYNEKCKLDTWLKQTQTKPIWKRRKISCSGIICRYNH